MAECFIATLPFSILAISPRFGPSGRWIVGPRDVVVSERSGDKVILPIFTDDDLVDRYNAAGGYGAEVILIDDAEAALNAVSSLVALHKVTHVAWDPVFGRRVRNLELASECQRCLRRSIPPPLDHDPHRPE